MHKPIFIALAGQDARIDDLFKRLSMTLSGSFSPRRCEFLEDPFKEYSEMISTRRSDLKPMERFFAYWSLFAGFNAQIVAPSFRGNADIILTRKYGFDLIAGSRPFEERTHMLEVHKLAVKKCIVDLDIAPPLYVFTHEPSPLEESLKKEYFNLPGQVCKEIDYRLSPASKAGAVIEIIRERIEQQGKQYAAA